MAEVEIKRILSGFNLGSPMQLQSNENPKSSAGLLPLFTCSNNPASVGSGWRFRLAGSDSVGLRKEVFWV